MRVTHCRPGISLVNSLCFEAEVIAETPVHNHECMSCEIGNAGPPRSALHAAASHHGVRGAPDYVVSQGDTGV